MVAKKPTQAASLFLPIESKRSTLYVGSSGCARDSSFDSTDAASSSGSSTTICGSIDSTKPDFSAALGRAEVEKKKKKSNKSVRWANVGSSLRVICEGGSDENVSRERVSPFIMKLGLTPSHSVDTIYVYDKHNHSGDDQDDIMTTTGDE